MVQRALTLTLTTLTLTLTLALALTLTLIRCNAMATRDEKQLLSPAKVGSLTLTLDPSHPNPNPVITLISNQGGLRAARPRGTTLG